MARQTDERKAWNVLESHIKALDWNPVAFTMCIVHSHPRIQARVMQTFLHLIDHWAEEFAVGAHTQPYNEIANEIRNLIRAFYDEAFPPKISD